MKVLIPFTVVMLCVGLGANIIQKGFLFTLKPLAPNFSKIDPIKGFKKLFSLTSFVELIKSILKILIIGLIVTLVVKGEISSFPTLIQMELKGMLVYIGSVTSKIILYVGLAMGGLALLDYMYQRWDYERGLKMSKQEVKDEYKQREGDPQVKARIKSLQRQWARQRMMEKVKEADVVITNPTHLAIAIQYESGKMIAPIVVAKGSGFIAQRIKDIARGAGVPVVENRFVAALLFKTVEIGQTIPQELYKAVAEILAYVYKLKGKV